MTQTAALSDLAPHYDALLCDVWGVIRDGRALLPAAVDALLQYRAGGGRVCLVSNSPQPRAELQAHLDMMGLPRAAYDSIVTSGDATRFALAERAPGPAFKLGPDWDDELYAGLALDFAPLEEARFISCTGLFDDEHETPDDYRAMLEGAAARGLDMVCANPDIVVQRGGRLIYCAGALARLYRELGGKSVIAGKPHRPIYELAFEALGEAAADKSRVLAIGDGPETDLLGAARMEVDALFIAGGILGESFNGGAFSLDAIAEALNSYGAASKWAAPQLVWGQRS